MNQFAWLGVTCSYLFGWVVCARQFARQSWTPVPPPDCPTDSKGEALALGTLWPLLLVFWVFYWAARLVIHLLMSDIDEPE